MYIKRSILTNNAKALARTNGRFGDIYRIILPESDSVMCETSTTLRIHRITYREARDKIESLAKGIVARFGANDRYIALYGENSPEWIMLFWAILRSGNRAYLINTRQPDYFTESVLSTLDAVGIVSLHGASGLSFCAEASVAELFELAKDRDALDDDAPFGNEIAITTSGTTLREKICIYHGENFSKQLLMTPEVTDDNKTLALPTTASSSILCSCRFITYSDFRRSISGSPSLERPSFSHRPTHPKSFSDACDATR